ncbi:MAG: hypothetical protein D6744_06990 [Planctomycetota bacterium]|nr:MAG: hypothetical protein D6744_06990 [Planctomycetota bacterium]
MIAGFSALLAAIGVCIAQTSRPDHDTDSRGPATTWERVTERNIETGWTEVLFTRFGALGAERDKHLCLLDPDGRIRRITCERTRQCSEFLYDGANHLQRTITKSPREVIGDIEHKYDSSGRRIETIDHTVAERTRFFYSGDANVKPEPEGLPQGVLIGMYMSTTEGEYMFPDGSWDPGELRRASFSYDEHLRLTKVRISDRECASEWRWTYELRLRYKRAGRIPVGAEWRRAPFGKDPAEGRLLDSETIDPNACAAGVQIILAPLHAGPNLYFTPRGVYMVELSDYLTPSNRLDRAAARLEPEHEAVLPYADFSSLPSPARPTDVRCFITFTLPFEEDPAARPPTGGGEATPPSFGNREWCSDQELDQSSVWFASPTAPAEWEEENGVRYRGWAVGTKRWAIVGVGNCNPGGELVVTNQLTTDLEKKVFGSFGIIHYKRIYSQRRHHREHEGIGHC